jgi:putative redox protein
MAENSLQRTVWVDSTAKSFHVDVKVGPFSLVGDAGPEYGGEDAGPNPYDYLMTALGTCTGMTVGLYARKMKMPLEHIRVKLTHKSIYAVDCEDCHQKDGTIEQLTREIELTGPLTDEQRQVLLGAAKKCPVAEILTHEIKIETRLVSGTAGAGASASAPH